MTFELTDDLIGTDVVIGDGQTVGTVVGIEGESLYVDFSDGGSDREQQEQFPASAIQEITDREVVLSERP
ncbi:MAG: hypothetical protein M8354_00180 [Halalkalicoccus sp.]|nr:hypothetical protein [Halalkalicoccus sp.]